MFNFIQISYKGENKLLMILCVCFNYLIFTATHILSLKYTKRKKFCNFRSKDLDGGSISILCKTIDKECTFKMCEIWLTVSAICSLLGL